ncbi:hypothetical protein SY83_12760 [Paenibacillus swuensis]|uniref:BIG2 domain-containing protein n=1 Tax=Paenibacillus swuensis TaxID=1178515 RepID=A0A172TQ09_9BACL|nr:hypothetical protein SY83_12760 [Paenibacillus swuensis]
MNAVFDTGRTVDVSPLVTWVSSNSASVTVKDGVVTAVKKGSATIKAIYQNKYVTFRVMVYA